jgi:hypothetical protein
MIYRDGKMDGHTPDGMQPVDMAALAGSINIQKLADSLGDILASKLNVSMSGLTGVAVAHTEDETESLRGIAEAMSSGGKDIQLASGVIGKEKNISGDVNKNKNTIDLLGNI